MTGRPLALALLLAAGCSRPVAGFLPRTLTGPDGRPSRYTVFVPHSYAPDKPVPALLFLHGGGEAGTDGVKPTTVGVGPAVRARAATFPFLVVFPQASEFVPAAFGTWHPDRPDGRRALAALDAACAEFAVDPRRVYLTGVSVGGHGVWQMAAHAPDRWSAVAPVCALAYRKRLDVVAGVPCWCFHGDDDGVVPVRNARDMVAELRTLGGTPRLTEYPGVGHDSWTKAYDTDELYEWLLRHRRPAGPTGASRP